VQGQALMTKDEYLVTVKTFVIIPNDRLGVINILFAIDQFPPVQTYTDGDFYENSGIRWELLYLSMHCMYELSSVHVILRKM